MLTRNDVEGFEYDWLAVDKDGFVAFFSTAGVGYTPYAILAEPATFENAISEILETTPVCDVSCDFRVGEGCVNTWRLIAERGIFAYDCEYSGAPYKLVAIPLMPVRIDAFPSSVRGVAGRIVLGDIEFRYSREVDVDVIQRQGA